MIIIKAKLVFTRVTVATIIAASKPITIRGENLERLKPTVRESKTTAARKIIAAGLICPAILRLSLPVKNKRGLAPLDFKTLNGM